MGVRVCRTDWPRRSVLTSPASRSVAAWRQAVGADQPRPGSANAVGRRRQKNEGCSVKARPPTREGVLTLPYRQEEARHQGRRGDGPLVHGQPAVAAVKVKEPDGAW